MFINGLKAPNWSSTLIVTQVLLLNLCIGVKERVGIAWSHDATDKTLDFKEHWSVSWKDTGLAKMSEYSDSEISSTYFWFLGTDFIPYPKFPARKTFVLPTCREGYDVTEDVCFCWNVDFYWKVNRPFIFGKKMFVYDQFTVIGCIFSVRTFFQLLNYFFA